jgi:hypothetical protein
MQIIAGEEKNIKCSISKSYDDNIKKNLEMILNIIDVIVVMGQRNIGRVCLRLSNERESQNFHLHV